MIDVVILIMIIFPLFYMIYGDTFMEKSGDFTLVNNLINYIFPFLAILVLWHYTSATPGKMFIKAKIVDAKTLQKPTMKQFIIRNLGYLVSLVPLGLGYYWAGWDSKKQTWHDKLAHTVVVQPKTEVKKKSIGSYIAIGFGVFAIGVFGVILTLGFMLQSGMMPDGDLYNAKKLPSSVTVSLVEQDILSERDIVHYYQPHSVFSFTGSATIFTQTGIVYFEEDELGELLKWEYPYKHIHTLKLDTEEFGLGIDIVTMTLMSDDGEMDFYVGLTPKVGNSEQFKTKVLELWKNARK